jgi:hypothetical protein
MKLLADHNEYDGQVGVGLLVLDMAVQFAKFTPIYARILKISKMDKGKPSAFEFLDLCLLHNKNVNLTFFSRKSAMTRLLKTFELCFRHLLI